MTHKYQHLYSRVPSDDLEIDPQELLLAKRKPTREQKEKLGIEGFKDLPYELCVAMKYKNAYRYYKFIKDNSIHTSRDIYFCPNPKNDIRYMAEVLSFLNEFIEGAEGKKTTIAAAQELNNSIIENQEMIRKTTLAETIANERIFRASMRESQNLK
ncbi:MAG: hypothetical protein LBM01_03515 [Christensenellaceae bacterium]|jgi:hypothetical protein|nr:hypothetical protein [Christensenellaceae bacterium]